MGHKVFDQWVEVYEWMVDWPRRLEREGPLFRRLFEQTGVRRVVDVACGPGYHAALFHRWGLEVEGADLSEAMIQRAILLHGQPPGLRWTVRPFQNPTPNPGYFDAAVCIGNSLALAGDKHIATEAVRQMFRAVRPGGLVVIQVLNLWALPEGKLCWQKCLAAPIGGKPKLILKAAHRVGHQVVVDLLLVRPEANRSASPNPATLGCRSRRKACRPSRASCPISRQGGLPLSWRSCRPHRPLCPLARQGGLPRLGMSGRPCRALCRRLGVPFRSPGKPRVNFCLVSLRKSFSRWPTRPGPAGCFCTAAIPTSRICPPPARTSSWSPGGQKIP